MGPELRLVQTNSGMLFADGAVADSVMLPGMPGGSVDIIAVVDVKVPATVTFVLNHGV